MRMFQPQVPQMSAAEQYPQSSMRLPQQDAIRRARMNGRSPLYSAPEEVMGGTKPAQDMAGNAMLNMGGMKPMAEQPQGFGGTKPFQDMTTKPGIEGRQDPTSRIGRPGVPGAAKPAPVMSPQTRRRVY